MMGNHFDLMNSYAFQKGPFFAHVNQAQTRFRQVVEMKNDPPLAQKTMAEGLEHLAEAIGEMGLRLDMHG